MNPEVECYAGSAYPEAPRAFTWEDQRYTVIEILHRWRTPEGVGFLVKSEPGSSFFDLFYLTEEDRWQIQPEGNMIIKEPSQTKPSHQGD